MARKTTAHRIGVLEYPGAQRASVYGLVDLLQCAERIRGELGGAGRRLDVGIVPTERLPTRAPPFAALVLPPSIESSLPEPQPRLIQWIRTQHGRGTTLCSVCAGAFVLARTGLLDGRRATTHWALADPFAERFPAVRLDADALLIDDGDLLTAGGVMAWIDLALRLTERFIDPAVMLATARYFLVDPGGREQRFYRRFAPDRTHGDAAVLRAQHWLQAHSADKVTIPMMAERAGLQDRTFLRRFQRATGMKPTRYLQSLRVERAREQLERSGQAIDEIAWEVGYEDPSAFRKVFHRLMGLSPGEYRRRFCVAR